MTEQLRMGDGTAGRLKRGRRRFRAAEGGNPRGRTRAAGQDFCEGLRKGGKEGEILPAGTLRMEKRAR